MTLTISRLSVSEAYAIAQKVSELRSAAQRRKDGIIDLTNRSGYSVQETRPGFYSLAPTPNAAYTDESGKQRVHPPKQHWSRKRGLSASVDELVKADGKIEQARVKAAPQSEPVPTVASRRDRTKHLEIVHQSESGWVMACCSFAPSATVSCSWGFGHHDDSLFRRKHSDGEKYHNSIGDVDPLPEVEPTEDGEGVVELGMRPEPAQIEAGIDVDDEVEQDGQESVEVEVSEIAADGYAENGGTDGCE